MPGNQCDSTGLLPVCFVQHGYSAVPTNANAMITSPGRRSLPKTPCPIQIPHDCLNSNFAEQCPVRWRAPVVFAFVCTDVREPARIPQLYVAGLKAFLSSKCCSAATAGPPRPPSARTVTRSRVMRPTYVVFWSRIPNLRGELHARALATSPSLRRSSHALCQCGLGSGDNPRGQR